jgi:hypothetical protein
MRLCGLTQVQTGVTAGALSQLEQKSFGPQTNKQSFGPQTNKQPTLLFEAAKRKVSAF